jgi:hypothetical protein
VIGWIAEVHGPVFHTALRLLHAELFTFFGLAFYLYRKYSEQKIVFGAKSAVSTMIEDTNAD